MRKGDCSEYGGPKYKSQKKVFDQVKVVFEKAIINRELLLNSQVKHEHKDKIIILSAIDNLIKGGAGQAIQNLNIKFNFPLKTALK